MVIVVIHCLRDNLNLRIKTESVLRLNGILHTVHSIHYSICFSARNKYVNKTEQVPLQQAWFLCGDSDYFWHIYQPCREGSTMI